MQQIQLSEHFTIRKLLRFTLPSIAMMIFTSIYGVVDGFFVSNYAGATAFAAVNLILPYTMMFGGIGFMFGSGGTALVSMVRGQGRHKEANEIFSLVVYVLLAVGVILSVIGFLTLRPVAVLLGATDAMLPYCITYGRILMLGQCSFMLQYFFQNFLIAAEKPHLGLAVTVAAGLTNMVLDGLFLAVFSMGVAGAAAATVTSQCIGGLLPLIYFILPGNSPLHLGRTRWNPAAIGKVILNGSSELMTNLSSNLVTMLYNMQLMKLAGESGVAAYGVIMYVFFIFVAVFVGYSMGSASIVSYHYGAGNHAELQGLRQKGLSIIAVSSILLTVLAQIFARPLAMIFVSYDAELLALTVHGFRIFIFTFLLMGFNIWGSSFFTALNDGKISALISFGRTLVFQLFAILVLPLFLGLNGVWSANILAEGLALFLTGWCLRHYQGKYHY